MRRRTAKKTKDEAVTRSLAEIGAPYELDSNAPKFIEITSRDTDGDTLLHRAALRGNRPDVRDLVSLGADINSHGDMGYTALHFAAMNGHIVVVEALLDMGADPTQLNEWKQTPADVAQHANHKRVALLLRAAC